MDNPAYVVALVLGAIMLLSVCFVYVKHTVLQLGGISLAGFAVILVGMSVWRSIDVSFNESGFTAKLEQAIKAAEAAKQEVAEIKLVSEQNAQAAVALKDTLETFKVQEALRQQGFYNGVLDGQLDADTTASLKQFQEKHRIVPSGDLDLATIKALGVKPVKNFPNKLEDSLKASAVKEQ